MIEDRDAAPLEELSHRQVEAGVETGDHTRIGRVDLLWRIEMEEFVHHAKSVHANTATSFWPRLMRCGVRLAMSAKNARGLAGEIRISEARP